MRSYLAALAALIAISSTAHAEDVVSLEVKPGQYTVHIPDKYNKLPLTTDGKIVFRAVLTLHCCPVPEGYNVTSRKDVLEYTSDQVVENSNKIEDYFDQYFRIRTSKDDTWAYGENFELFIEKKERIAYNHKDWIAYGDMLNNRAVAKAVTREQLNYISTEGFDAKILEGVGVLPSPKDVDSGKGTAEYITKDNFTQLFRSRGIWNFQKITAKHEGVKDPSGEDVKIPFGEVTVSWGLELKLDPAKNTELKLATAVGVQTEQPAQNSGVTGTADPQLRALDAVFTGLSGLITVAALPAKAPDLDFLGGGVITRNGPATAYGILGQPIDAKGNPRYQIQGMPLGLVALTAQGGGATNVVVGLSIDPTSSMTLFGGYHFFSGKPTPRPRLAFGLAFRIRKVLSPKSGSVPVGKVIVMDYNLPTRPKIESVAKYPCVILEADKGILKEIDGKRIRFENGVTPIYERIGGKEQWVVWPKADSVQSEQGEFTLLKVENGKEVKPDTASGKYYLKPEGEAGKLYKFRIVKTKP